MFNLTGKKGLIVGVANKHSLAFSCAQLLHTVGAHLIVSYANEKAAPYVLPLKTELPEVIFTQCDVRCDKQLMSLIELAEAKLGRIDFIIHSVAYAPLEDLHGRILEAHREGFLLAMEISCWSLIRIVKIAEPLLNPSSSLITMSYLGSERAVQNYNLMGPVKSALESSVRYLALELGEQGHRVNAVSPGPIKTRAASGLNDFDTLLDKSAERAPLKRALSAEDVAGAVLYLVSDLSQAVTGATLYVDNGYHVVD